MNQDTENFEQLRRVLVLKRHEQPPPGYFNNFSRQVIARIEAGERGAAGALIDRLVWEAPWLQRIWAAFEAKPILAGACVAAVCGLLITGVVCTDKTDVSPSSFVPGTQLESALRVFPSVSAADHPLLAKPVVFESSSTNPITTARADESLMGGIGMLRAQPASFSFPDGN
jgi:hypothetical protein